MFSFSKSLAMTYMLRAATWRITRFILFVHDGNLAIIALSFLNYCYKNLFEDLALMLDERERFTHMLVTFLYINRNRVKDPGFKESMDASAKLIEKLICHLPSNKDKYWNH